MLQALRLSACLLPVGPVLAFPTGIPGREAFSRCHKRQSLSLAPTLHPSCSWRSALCVSVLFRAGECKSFYFYQAIILKFFYFLSWQ